MATTRKTTKPAPVLSYADGRFSVPVSQLQCLLRVTSDDISRPWAIRSLLFDPSGPRITATDGHRVAVLFGTSEARLAPRSPDAFLIPRSTFESFLANTPVAGLTRWGDRIEINPSLLAPDTSGAVDYLAEVGRLAPALGDKKATTSFDVPADDLSPGRFRVRSTDGGSWLYGLMPVRA